MKILTILAALSFWAAGNLYSQDPQAATATATDPAPPPSAPALHSAAELEKLVMPIALYPDPLIAIVLPASVYPVEIVQAARFVKDTNNLPKVDDQSWDENVKAVAKFPSLIAKLDADLSWTVDLGQTFLEQPKELMDTIQSLRAKAQSAGTLQNSPQQVVVVTNVIVEKTVEQQVVVVTNTIIQIQPANPQVIYVPTYPYTVYYPPPAYVYNPYAPLVTFGVGIAVGAIIANNCNWYGGGIYVGHHGSVNVNINRNVNINNNYNRNVNVNNPRPTPYGGGADQKWQPDQNRLRTSGAAPSTQTREARGWGSATTQPSTGTVGTRPSTGTATTRPSTGTATTRPSTGTATTRPSTEAVTTRPSTGATTTRPSGGTDAARPSTGTVANRPSTGTTSGSRPTASPTQNRSAYSPQTSPSANRSSSGSSAFNGVNSGSSSQSSSNRGATSRGGGGRGR